MFDKIFRNYPQSAFTCQNHRQNCMVRPFDLFAISGVSLTNYAQMWSLHMLKYSTIVKISSFVTRIYVTFSCAHCCKRGLHLFNLAFSRGKVSMRQVTRFKAPTPMYILSTRLIFCFNNCICRAGFR